MAKEKKICDNCWQFRIKSDNYVICDSKKNLTKVMTVPIIQRLTGCEKDIAEEINESVRYHKNFGCIHFESWPDKSKKS